MDLPNLSALGAQIADLQAVRDVGRVTHVHSNTLSVSGLSHVAKLGDRVLVHRRSESSLSGELIQLSVETVTVLADSDLSGVSIGDRVSLTGSDVISPSDAWIGRVVDPFGKPLDGRSLRRGLTARDIRATPPVAAQRRALGDRLETGMCVFNTLLPIVQGQRMGLFSGSGVGKSTLLGQLARNMSADVVVLALIGERGRELRDFVESVLGPDGMARSVIVAATSDQSPLIRRRCAWSAMAVAEYFRDQGKRVLFLADSITRFAEAHREIAVAAGELPSLRGFPASTAHTIMALCERAGPGSGAQGDITALFSVLVAGSDMEEPIADILRGVLDGHVVLDRKIAERGRFPAIDLLKSVSRSLPRAANASENQSIQTARSLLGSYAQSETMVRAGLYAEGSDPELDRAVALWPALDAFLGEAEQDSTANSFAKLDLILRRASGRPKSKLMSKNGQDTNAARPDIKKGLLRDRVRPVSASKDLVAKQSTGMIAKSK